MFRRTLLRCTQAAKGDQLSTLRNSVSIVSGTPAEQLKRKYIVYRPTPNAMQSAPGSNKWVVCVAQVTDRWANPLMGWVSTSDPLSKEKVTFGTKEAAVEYCAKNGFDYEVLEAKEAKIQAGQKWYGQHFAYKKPNKWDEIYKQE